ncbi:MAG: BlaI/MecI/CopY family transcriptional regulator [Gemmatimonadota bacterium]|jgi:predicted transcriptional regulator
MMLSGRELDVMNVLWERGSATVSEVLEELQDELAYTTVLTILRRLEEKGHVRHDADGKAHRYLPLVHREEAQDSAIQRVTRKLFLDSPALLMSRLLRKGTLTEAELRALRTLVDERLRERGEG